MKSGNRFNIVQVNIKCNEKWSHCLPTAVTFNVCLALNDEPVVSALIVMYIQQPWLSKEITVLVDIY